MSKFRARVTEGEHLGLTGTSTADDDEVRVDLISEFEQNARRRAVEKNDSRLDAQAANPLGPRAFHVTCDVRVRVVLVAGLGVLWPHIEKADRMRRNDLGVQVDRKLRRKRWQPDLIRETHRHQQGLS